MGYLYFLLLLVLLLLLLLQQVDRKYLPVDAGEGDEAMKRRDAADREGDAEADNDADRRLV